MGQQLGRLAAPSGPQPHHPQRRQPIGRGHGAGPWRARLLRPAPAAPAFHPSGSAGATSFYDTTPLKATLERLVDFDRINARKTRFSVGAVNVRTGNFAYFDNATDVIRPEHIMASGALPPASPVEVDGEHYWDGGLVSNTPLDWVLSSNSGLDTLVFQVDLWSARGNLPPTCPASPCAPRKSSIPVAPDPPPRSSASARCCASPFAS
jgi:predicted acylesterase/phospholipase RssA